MRSLVAGLLELCGATALVVGTAQISSAFGWITAGSLALVAAWRSAQ
jgi:hypothetical protein